MGLFKNSGDHQHGSQASVGSAVSSCPSSSSASSASAPARDRTTAVRSPAPQFVNSLVTWEKQNEQKQPPPPPPQPSKPTRGERAQYAHAGTDWEARNNPDARAGGKEPPKKPSWTKRLFKGPGLGVYGS